MRTLIINGQPMPNQEAEYIQPHEGFIVHNIYKDGDVRIFNNVTEIHWALKTGLNEIKYAYESDVHNTGICAKFTNCIATIVYDAVEYEKHFEL